MKDAHCSPPHHVTAELRRAAGRAPGSGCIVAFDVAVAVGSGLDASAYDECGGPDSTELGRHGQAPGHRCVRRRGNRRRATWPPDSSRAEAAMAVSRPLEFLGVGSVQTGVEVIGDAAVTAHSPLDVRGLWAAAGIHAGAFRRRRLVSLLALSTATRRVDAPHAVATLLAVGNRLSMVAWSIAVGVSLVCVSLMTLVGLAVSPLAFAASLPLIAVCFVVGCAGLRRVQAWWQWHGVRGGLLVADVAADPRGNGFGGGLMDGLARYADASGHTLVLRAAAGNPQALHLYTSRGFAAVGPPEAKWTYMVRTPAHRPPDALQLPRARSRRVPALTFMIGALTAGGLVAVFWGEPVVWLMPAAAGVATAGAWFDLDRRRVPNRLTASGTVGVLALAVVVKVVFGVDLVLPAVDRCGDLVAAAARHARHLPRLPRVSATSSSQACLVWSRARCIRPRRTPPCWARWCSVWAGGCCGGRAVGAAPFRSRPAIAAAAVVLLTVWPLMGGPTTW